MDSLGLLSFALKQPDAGERDCARWAWACESPLSTRVWISGDALLLCSRYEVAGWSEVASWSVCCATSWKLVYGGQRKVRQLMKCSSLYPSHLAICSFILGEECVYYKETWHLEPTQRRTLLEICPLATCIHVQGGGTGEAGLRQMCWFLAPAVRVPKWLGNRDSTLRASTLAGQRVTLFLRAKNNREERKIHQTHDIGVS